MERRRYRSTDVIARWLRPGTRVRALADDDRADAVALMRARPYTAILAAAHLGTIGRGYEGAQMLGVENDGALAAVCWAGSNLVPVGELDAMQTLGAHLRRRGRHATSIVGRVDLVMALWRDLAPTWPAPREVRGDQPALVMDRHPACPAAAELRVARSSDFEALLPAAVAMFTEEVGYDPTRAGSGYASYVRGLVHAGRSYILTDGGRVVFKADIGAMWEGVAQIQGVWVHPGLRNQGLGARGMAAVVNRVIDEVAPVVTLYVNQYNGPARRVYEKVGFTQADTYATILF